MQVESHRGSKDYCDIFVDTNDNTFRRDWRIWCLLVLCKLITVQRSGSSLHSICHETRPSSGMFSGNTAAALPMIFFKKTKVWKMPPGAGAQCIGWHISVQWFCQEAATESQNKDEVIFNSLWHGGGGKWFQLMVEEKGGKSRQLKGSGKLTAQNLESLAFSLHVAIISNIWRLLVKSWHIKVHALVQTWLKHAIANTHLCLSPVKLVNPVSYNTSESSDSENKEQTL